MSRYTAPRPDDGTTTFRKRPLWVRVSVWICLAGVIALTFSSFITLLVR